MAAAVAVQAALHGSSSSGGPPGGLHAGASSAGHTAQPGRHEAGGWQGAGAPARPMGTKPLPAARDRRRSSMSIVLENIGAFFSAGKAARPAHGERADAAPAPASEPEPDFNAARRGNLHDPTFVLAAAPEDRELEKKPVQVRGRRGSIAGNAKDASEVLREVDRLQNPSHASHVLHPEGRRKHGWDLLIVLAVLYQVFALPLHLAFKGEAELWQVAVEVAVDLVFLADIGVNFRTGFYHAEGELVMDPGEIARRYVRRMFAFDAVASIPLQTFALLGVGTSADLQLLALLKLPRLLRISRLVDLLDRMHSGKAANIGRIFQSFLSMITFSHWIAAAYIIVCEHEDVDANGLGKNEHPRDRYIAALYMAFLLLLGSDISPETSGQRLFSVITLLVGACFYAIVVGNMALLMANFNISQTRQRQKLELLGETMGAYRIPAEHAARVRDYYEYMLQTNRDLEGLAMLRELPPAMFKEIAHALHADAFDHVPMFKDASPGFVSALVVRLQPQVYLMDQLIISRGDVGKEMYFIVRGHTQVLNKMDVPIVVLGPGQFFGEVALLVATRRTASVAAVTTCDLNALSMADFVECLQDFPHEHGFFQEQAMERLNQLKVQMAEDAKSSRKQSMTDQAMANLKGDGDQRTASRRRFSLGSMSYASDEGNGGAASGPPGTTPEPEGEGEAGEAGSAKSERPSHSAGSSRSMSRAAAQKLNRASAGDSPSGTPRSDSPSTRAIQALALPARLGDIAPPSGFRRGSVIGLGGWGAPRSSREAEREVMGSRLAQSSVGLADHSPLLMTPSNSGANLLLDAAPADPMASPDALADGNVSRVNRGETADSRRASLATGMSVSSISESEQGAGAGPPEGTLVGMAGIAAATGPPGTAESPGAADSGPGPLDSDSLRTASRRRRSMPSSSDRDENSNTSVVTTQSMPAAAVGSGPPDDLTNTGGM